jgi:hypothetical protein
MQRIASIVKRPSAVVWPGSMPRIVSNLSMIGLRVLDVAGGAEANADHVLAFRGERKEVIEGDNPIDLRDGNPGSFETSSCTSSGI